MSVYRWFGFSILAGAMALGVIWPVTAADQSPAQPNEAKTVAAKQPSPLDKDIEEAKERLASMEKDIKDYSFTLVKRERVNGQLLPHEAIFTKIRHEPFSVYMYFLTPAEKKGQQVVFIKGRNNDNLVAQPVGLVGKLGPYYLPTTGPLAMQGQRYPITELGVINLTRRLIEVGSKSETAANCFVKHYDPVKVKAGSEPRICRMTEVIHPVKGPNTLFHKARIYIDKERNIPIRFESYDFPKEAGGEPELLEEYTYADVKLNNNFTDADFEIRQQ